MWSGWATAGRMEPSARCRQTKDSWNAFWPGCRAVIRIDRRRREPLRVAACCRDTDSVVDCQVDGSFRVMMRRAQLVDLARGEQTHLMKLAGFTAAIILLANVILATLMYATVGWHFVRGYNEVANFLVVPCAVVQAAVNLFLAASVVLVARWRRMPGVHIAAISFCLSAAMVLFSPLFTPVLGSVANRRLWIKTPLVEAARYGDAETVITLVRNGANPNARQIALGTTALHYMAAGGEVDAVEALLAYGADPNARAATSLETPLHWAIRSRANTATIRSLVTHALILRSKTGVTKLRRTIRAQSQLRCVRRFCGPWVPGSCSVMVRPIPSRAGMRD